METQKPMNRQERRMQKRMEKKANKKRQIHLDNMTEAIKKATYINLIEKVRELNKEKEEDGSICREECQDSN